MANCTVVRKRIDKMIERCHIRLIEELKALHDNEALYVEKKKFLWGKAKPYKYTTSSQRKAMIRLDNGCWMQRDYFMHWWLDQRGETLTNTIAVVDVADYDGLTEECLNRLICGMERIATLEGYSAVDMWNIYDPHIALSSMDLREDIIDAFNHVTGRNEEWEDDDQC